MSIYRLFPSSPAGPETAVSYTEAISLAVQFGVATGGCWLEGYWFWVCKSGAPTKAQEFGLWQAWQDSGEGYLVTDATVTSGTLTAGAWNYVALPQPVPLSVGATYIAATGLTGGFPQTTNQFGAGDTYSAGITNGPLFAYSDQSGSAPAPDGLPQGLYSTASADPTKYTPENGNSSANFWVDVQITTTPPSGASYRLWPSYGTIPGAVANDPFGQSFGTEFHLSEQCTLSKLWFYSPPTVTQLPTACAIWNVPSDPTTATMISGTELESPAWSGGAGTGWVSADYSGVTLPAGQYKATVYCSVDALWYQENTHYFSSPQNSVQSVAISLKPSGWWELNDSATDSSGNSNNGTVNGGVTFGAAGPLEGGTAASFNGSTGFISTDLNFSSSWTGLSFAGFIKIPSGSAPTLGVVGSNNSAADGGAFLQVADSGGKLSVQLNIGTASVPFVSDTTWADSEWHHVAVSWDGSTGDVVGYVDGDQVGTTTTITATMSAGSSGVSVGAAGGTFFDGGLAQVLVTNWPIAAAAAAGDDDDGDDPADAADALYFPSQFTTGPGWNGITNGPLSSPNIVNSGAVIGNWTNLPMTGNSSYSNPDLGSFTYPYLNDVKDDGENRWVDVEVTAAVVTPPPVPASPSVVLTFFP
jgi:hypothetical protein